MREKKTSCRELGVQQLCAAKALHNNDQVGQFKKPVTDILLGDHLEKKTVLKKRQDRKGNTSMTDVTALNQGEAHAPTTPTEGSKKKQR